MSAIPPHMRGAAQTNTRQVNPQNKDAQGTHMDQYDEYLGQAYLAEAEVRLGEAEKHLANARSADKYHRVLGQQLQAQAEATEDVKMQLKKGSLNPISANKRLYDAFISVKQLFEDAASKTHYLKKKARKERDDAKDRVKESEAYRHAANPRPEEDYRPTVGAFKAFVTDMKEIQSKLTKTEDALAAKDKEIERLKAELKEAKQKYKDNTQAPAKKGTPEGILINLLD